MCEAKYLEIQLLGGITVRYGENVVGIGTSGAKSGKLWTLFEYIVLNNNRVISQDELIDRMWPEMEVSNPANSLKVLMFKLRKELDSLGGVPGKEVIRSADGGYRFNREIPYQLDIEQFDRYLEEVRASQDTEKRIGFLLDAIDCYKGHIYMDAKRESWALPVQTHYYELFEKAIRTLAALLLDKGEYQKIIDICKNALLIQPYSEEFYYYIIRSYTLMKKYSAASDMYKKVRAVLSDEFGTMPDARLESAYKEILKQKPKGHMTIEEMHDDLEEKKVYAATYFVEYGEFRSIYRLMARRVDRIKNKSYLCIYSLNTQKGISVTKDVLQNHIRIMGQALAFGLRQSDIFCRSGANQFAVLLEDIKEENTINIANRIKAYFEQNRENPGFTVGYQAREIESAYFGEKTKILTIDR